MITVVDKGIISLKFKNVVSLRAVFVYLFVFVKKFSANCNHSLILLQVGFDGHYDEIYRMCTSESSRPSLQKKPQRKKTLPFHGVLQHVKNVDMMLECMECSMWRLLYSKKKLSRHDKKRLQDALDEWEFTCGAPLQDLELCGPSSEVYMRDVLL